MELDVLEKQWTAQKKPSTKYTKHGNMLGRIGGSDADRHETTVTAHRPPAGVLASSRQPRLVGHALPLHGVQRQNGWPNPYEQK
jgi:hypothetical protein